MKISTSKKIFIASTFSKLVCFFRSLFGIGTTGIFKRAGLFWKLDLKEGIDFSIFLLGSFEPRTQELYRRILLEVENAVVFDIGANIGSHTLPLAQLVCQTNGHVFSFEPTIWAINKLQNNLNLNPRIRDRVILKHALLVSDVDCNITPEIYSGWPLHKNTAKLHPVHGGELHKIGGAARLRLDDFVEAYGLSRIDLMKIDVDGHEPLVIDGAWDSITSFRPEILMEWSPHLFTQQPDVMESIIVRLLKLDYEIFDADTIQPLTLDKLHKLTPIGGSINLYISTNSRRLR